MTKLVLNIERVGWSKLEGQRRHDQRIGGDLSHVDLDASEDNLVLHGSGDAKADVRACLDKFEAAPRADNETPFNRFVIQPGDGFDWSNPKAIGKWLKLSKKWLQDEYGEGFVYAVLHTDERTPHIHAVCVPLYQSKTKHREAWKVSHKQHPATKGKGSYERLRRRCADALGFEYGDPGNKPRTEAQRLADEAAVARAAGLLSAARATAQGIVSRAKGLLAETEGRVARISKDLDHAAKMADLVGMEARAQAARQQKAKITPHTAAVRAMQ
ncbi:plasmid recombination protein, partial [Sulfitobacter geojensis]